VKSIHQVRATSSSIPTGKKSRGVINNASIAELLAIEAETAKQPLQKALRRASRRAFLWPDEAAQLFVEGRSLEDELAGVGPHLSRIIRHWIVNPPLIPDPPNLRADFLTLPQARSILANTPSWARRLKGDLQMHTEWSDGSGSIEQMAEAAAERGYEYIAITDHSKGLKIAGGIDEGKLLQQAAEIEHVNEMLAEKPLRLLAFAGLWDKWINQQPEAIESCSILTTTANSLLSVRMTGIRSCIETIRLPGLALIIPAPTDRFFAQEGMSHRHLRDCRASRNASLTATAPILPQRSKDACGWPLSDADVLPELAESERC
jgi:hypothetical protein